MKIIFAPLKIMQLLVLIALSSCSIITPHPTDSIELVETKLLTEKLSSSLAERVIQITPPGPGTLEISFSVKPSDLEMINNVNYEVGEPIIELRITEPFNPKVQAKTGSTELAMRIASEQMPRDGTPITVSLNIDGSVLNIGIRNPLTSADFDIDYEPPRPDKTTIELPVNPIVCNGSLFGFLHPFRFEEQGFSSRPKIYRAGVGVRCVAEYVYNLRGKQYPIIIKSEYKRTDSQGNYEVTIAPKIVSIFIEKIQPNVPIFIPDPILAKISAECISKECGFEAFGVPESVKVPASQVSSNYLSHINNVLDLTVSGPAAPAIIFSGETILPNRPLLGARLITNGKSLQERNDHPFILHEQIDVLDRESTQFLAWGILGQPVHTTRKTLNGEIIDADPRKDPCNLDASKEGKQLCVGGTEDCNYHVCNTGDVICLGYGMLQVLLKEGYDVWLVDSLSGETDLLRQAAAAPVLYQNILNYGGPLGGPLMNDPLLNSSAAVSIRANIDDSATPEEFPINNAYLNSLWPEFASDQEKLEMIRPSLPSLPSIFPQSGDRKIIVAGYSQGGVVARTALLLWKQKNSLPMLGIKDFMDEPLTLSTDRNVILEQIESKVDLYVSIDAPHRGSTIPASLQAYFQRIGQVIAGTDLISEEDKEVAFDALKELNAPPAQQLVLQRVNSSKDFGCWDVNSNGELKSGDSCTIIAQEVIDANLVSSDEAQNFQDITLSTLDPSAMSDGLPDGIRSIALANGGFDDHNVRSGVILNVKFDIKNTFDKHHRLCANEAATGFCFHRFQTGGAQWNGICQRIGDISVGKNLGNFGEWTKQACWSKTTIETALLSCPIGWTIGLFEGFDAKLRNIKFTFPMSAELDVNGKTKEGTGFPTLVPTESALLGDGNGNPSPGWYDAYWPDNNLFHTNIDDEMCKFIMFHLDASVGGDGDGFPACGIQSERLECSKGGRKAGRLINNQADVCDCDDDDPSVYPGALELFDFKDNDCDGRVDEIAELVKVVG